MWNLVASICRSSLALHGLPFAVYVALVGWSPSSLHTIFHISKPACFRSICAAQPRSAKKQWRGAGWEAARTSMKPRFSSVRRVWRINCPTVRARPRSCRGWRVSGGGGAAATQNAQPADPRTRGLPPRPMQMAHTTLLLPDPLGPSRRFRRGPWGRSRGQSRVTASDAAAVANSRGISPRPRKSESAAFGSGRCWAEAGQRRRKTAAKRCQRRNAAPGSSHVRSIAVQRVRSPCGLAIARHGRSATAGSGPCTSAEV